MFVEFLKLLTYSFLSHLSSWKKHARAAVVNAYYNALENSIEFPAGILQGSFFSKDRPKYVQKID